MMGDGASVLILSVFEVFLAQIEETTVLVVGGLGFARLFLLVVLRW